MTIRPQDNHETTRVPPNSTLTSAQFHILLTLADEARHGYGIMQEVDRRTEGSMELGPGTLYRSIKQILAKGFIVEMEGVPGGPADTGKPRRSYGLTPEGRARMVEEAQRLRALVRWADDAVALEGGRLLATA